MSRWQKRRERTKMIRQMHRLFGSQIKSAEMIRVLAAQERNTNIVVEGKGGIGPASIECKISQKWSLVNLRG